MASAFRGRYQAANLRRNAEADRTVLPGLLFSPSKGIGLSIIREVMCGGDL